MIVLVKSKRCALCTSRQVGPRDYEAARYFLQNTTMTQSEGMRAKQ